MFLRYACIRLLGVGFTDGFFSFSCWGDRRRLMAYWAVADGLLLFLVGNTSWGYGEGTCVAARRDGFVAEEGLERRCRAL